MTAAIWVETTWHNVARPNPHVTTARIQKKQNEEIRRANTAFWEQMEREGWGFPFKDLEKFFEDVGTPRAVREGRKANPTEPSGTWPGWNDARHDCRGHGRCGTQMGERLLVA